MKKKINITVLCCLLCSYVSAQTSARIYRLEVGYSIGGSMPVPLPREIRKIDMWAPELFAPHLAIEALNPFNERWAISAKIAFDRKGFTVRDRVKSLYTEITTEDGTVQAGNFTGKNQTQVDNYYLSVPVALVYSHSEHRTSRIGLYCAWMLRPLFIGQAVDGYIRQGDPTGEKIAIPYAEFDFSDRLRRFDYGLMLAEHWVIHPRWALIGEITCGLRPLFSDSFKAMPFKMRNIYGILGVSYLLM
ncbi:MAG: PorT family protein [Candidatus Symbiothrix sp.]|jgi:hypothetical protein|nr:PorT family protein [Candidatus Symbiothrix sp.]